MPGCLRSKLTVWKEDQFTVLPGQGIKNREARVAEWVAKALPLVKPGVWGCVQARAQWSTEEDAHMRPGHHWLCEFGDAGNGTSCERQFNLGHHDTSRPPVAMLINSSELRAAGFKLKEVLPPALEAAARVRTRGAGLRSLEGMGPKRFVLSVDDDTEFRSRCE